MEIMTFEIRHSPHMIVLLPCEPKKCARLVCCELKGMRPIFKTEIFIYQSKANFGEKI